jgi:hypothetical protein
MSSSVSILRWDSTSGVAVFTCMSGSQVRTQEAASARSPTSTAHMRHTPTGSSRGS